MVDKQEVDKPIYSKQLKSFILNALKVVPNNVQNNFVRMNMLQCYSNAVTARHCDALQICRFCGNNYYEVPKEMNLLPAPKLSRFLRRLRKINPDCGTPYQLSSIKKLRNSSKSQSIIRNCKFCKKKKRKLILKPDKFASEVIAEKTLKKTINKQITSANKKVKRMKKFAGLNENAVMSVKKLKLMLNNPENEINTSKSKKNVKNVIDLNTPQSSKSTRKNDIPTIILDTPVSNKNTNDISTIIIDTPIGENSVIEINDNTPVNKNKKAAHSSNIINLITPTIPTNSNSNTGTPKRTPGKSNILHTPKKNTKTAFAVATTSSNKNMAIRKVTPITTSKKRRKQKKQAKKNKILAGDTNKKGNTPNHLQNLLKSDNNANSSVSKLDKFLKSIS